MAENQNEEQQAKPKEREIPVFTVLKSNRILKNIFLLDNPPPISSSPSSLVSANLDQESEIEEILVVGRHPDCNIKLEHPSISRFHLRIHSKPSSRSLYVVDLSSVHGTWISGKRLESGVRMKLNEGDSLQLGASSRLYRLSWVPISRAYDLENPFVPQLDDPDTADEETDEAEDQDQDIVFERNDQENFLMSDNTEGPERLFYDEDFDSSMQKTSLVAPQMPKDLCNSVSPGLYSAHLETMETCEINSENIRSGSIPKDLDNKEENFTPEKENDLPDSPRFRSPKSKSEEKLKNEPILNTPISSVDRNKEIFTPDKENMTPNTRLFRSTKNIVDKSPKSSHGASPLKTTYNSNMYREEEVVFSLEASPIRKVFPKSTNSASNSNVNSEKKPVFAKARTNRDPFCPLPVHEENNARKMAENKWIIVVDTTSLLNKKSRNELQLLRGLRGTSLVIPKIVVRELDCMLRCGSIFRRMSEVSAALRYIEESMAIAKWWIHVQSSAEDMWPVSIGSTLFSPCSLQEIVSLTSGDHVLEYALYYKGIKKDRQLVLLTDDVTLKIKAMAEGVLCETAHEFRRSLVNPFSARFLYSNCSPVGPTWSCADDVVLKERYYPSPSKKVVSTPGGTTKGLKLILMHA